MHITVECYGALRDNIGGERATGLHLDGSGDVNEVIAALEIDARSVFQVLVNGESAARSRVLEEGDTVTLMPPFTGG